MRKLSIILISIGVAFILTSICMLCYNIYCDENAKSKSNEVRNKLEKIIINSEIETKEVSTIKIDDNNYIGVIHIESLDLKLPIMNDWDYKKMQIAPCRYYGAIETNDLVICAHSYKSMFANLKKLSQKDKVIITDVNNNEYVYEVELIEILKPEEVSAMIDSEFDLTLFTCTSDSSNRVTVRLNRI